MSNIRFVVSLVLLSLTTSLAFYYIYTRSPLPILFTAHSSQGISWSSIKIVPWTDMAENMTAAFLIAKHKLIYTDFVMNHLPGVPFTVSHVLKILMPADATAGLRTERSVYALSILTMNLMWVSLVAAFLKAYTRSSNLTIFIEIMIGICLVGCAAQLLVPMSETVNSLYVFLTFGHVLMLTRKPHETGLDDIILGFLLSVTAINGGLTSLLYFVIYGICVFLFFLYGWVTHGIRLTICGDGTRRAFLIVVLFWAWMSLSPWTGVDLGQAKLWNVDFNLATNSTNYVSNILSYAMAFSSVKIIWPGTIPFTSPSFVVSAASAASLLLAVKLGILSRSRALLFCLIASFLCFSLGWRTGSSGLFYKASLPFVGMLLWVYGFALHASAWKILKLDRFFGEAGSLLFKPSVGLTRSYHAVTALSILASFSFIFGLGWTKQGSFDHVNVAQVCNLSYQGQPSGSGCSCMTSAVWGPQLFLEDDVVPCRDHFPTLPPAFFEWKQSAGILKKSFESGRSSILLFRNSDVDKDVAPIAALIKESSCFDFSTWGKQCRYLGNPHRE